MQGSVGIGRIDRDVRLQIIKHAVRSVEDLAFNISRNEEDSELKLITAIMFFKVIRRVILQCLSEDPIAHGMRDDVDARDVEIFGQYIEKGFQMRRSV